MKLFAYILGVLFLVQVSAQEEKMTRIKPGLTAYKDYIGVMGEGFSGNVFIFRYNGGLVACMSRHQFDDDKVPSQALDLGAPPIPLDQSRAIKQTDVQILPLTNQNQAVQFMDYNSGYELKAGEELWINRGSVLRKEIGTTGKLRDRNLIDGKFKPKDGTRELVMDLTSAADVQGASGSPVIQVSTGKPVGVLLAADNGKAASYIVFEPICLPLTANQTKKGEQGAVEQPATRPESK